MSEYGDWIDSKGVTLTALVERHGIWVLDELPPAKEKGVVQWHADAEARDDLNHLIAKWLDGTTLPRPLERRYRFFETTVQESSPLALVVHNAHLLRSVVLLHCLRVCKMRVRPTVVLIGDAARIRTTMADTPEFDARASYVVSVARLF